MNNPYSQFQDEYSLEQIKAVPMVWEPLTKLQCCPTSHVALRAQRSRPIAEVRAAARSPRCSRAGTVDPRGDHAPRLLDRFEAPDVVDQRCAVVEQPVGLLVEVRVERDAYTPEHVDDDRLNFLLAQWTGAFSSSSDPV